MEKEFLQTETAGANGWTVWSVNGRIDMVTAEKAYATGEDIVNRNEKTVLDMSGMDYLSSAGLRVLLRLNRVYPVRAFRHCEIRTGRQRYGRFIYDLCFPE